MQAGLELPSTVIFMCSFAFISPASQEHFRDQREHSVQMFKRFYGTKKLDADTHTHRHNHAAEFVNEGVGGPQAQHQYICRDH